MASLSVRKLDDNVYNRLRIRANEHGVSMEEEARRIIIQAVSTPKEIYPIFEKYFGKKNGVDLDSLLKEHRKPHKPMDFDE